MRSPEHPVCEYTDNARERCWGHLIWGVGYLIRRVQSARGRGQELFILDLCGATRYAWQDGLRVDGMAANELDLDVLVSRSGNVAPSVLVSPFTDLQGCWRVVDSRKGIALSATANSLLACPLSQRLNSTDQ